MTDTDDDLIARARKSWHPSDQSGRIVHALCDEIERLVVWSSDSHVTELEARIAELEAVLDRLRQRWKQVGDTEEDWIQEATR